MTQTRDAAVRRTGLEILAVSFIVLFQELVLIRWIPVQVRIIAYFPNLILIGAFLGLGVGALRSRHRSLMWAWPVALLLLVASSRALSGIAFTTNRVTEHFWLLYHDLGESAPVVEGIHLPIVLLFTLTALSFVPLGQFLGARLEIFRVRSSALWGYAFDLGGSLLGVIAFAAISWTGVKPLLWFAPYLAVGVALLGRSRRLWVTWAAAALVIAVLVTRGTEHQRFSPYYALETVPVKEGEIAVRANGSLHQVALDLVREQGSRERLTALVGYRYPYLQLGRPIRKALVVGAGSGNDVAVLLQQGAQEVHAVEIDPVIVALGREMHPNDPYADPRVTVHTTDARSFLNETQESFDVIVFGTLDSMTKLSALSNVRLDNFMYTREALQAARARLTPDGGLVLYFMVGEPYIAQHLTAMLVHAFGTPPRVHQGSFYLFNTIYMAGPAFAGAGEVPGERVWSVPADIAAKLSPSDDWPYLYLPERGVNAFYLSTMAILAALAILAILLVSPEMRQSLRAGKGIDVEMFLFGFAFLLIETKFVTAMNLLWGTTWITSAVVFGSILGVILLGTLATERWAVRWPLAGAGLVAALVAVYAIPLHLLLSTSPTVRLALSVLFVGTPVLFASLCFAARFRVRPAADLAFGWNLLGAVLGGLAEFLSMALGFRALTGIALVAYLGAFLLAYRERQGSTRPLAGAPTP
ncbi:MAG: spermine/spermidine synthase domain-containing protein [Longimicrobiales bacterium]